MVTDIIKFQLLFLIIITPFSVGMHNNLHDHYQDQVRRVGRVEVRQSDAFLTRSLNPYRDTLLGHLRILPSLLRECHQRA